MVWLLSGSTGPEVTFGPMDPREEGAIMHYLATQVRDELVT